MRSLMFWKRRGRNASRRPAFSGDESKVCTCLGVVETSAGKVRQAKRAVEVRERRRGIVRQRASMPTRPSSALSREAPASTRNVPKSRPIAPSKLGAFDRKRQCLRKARNFSVVEASAKRARFQRLHWRQRAQEKQCASERELLIFKISPRQSPCAGFARGLF